MAELACSKCGEEVSGPNASSVKATMARHTKSKHPSRKPKA